MVGGPATAETTVIDQFLSCFNMKENSSSKTITFFSYLTPPPSFQMTVEVRLAATQDLPAKLT